MWSHALGLDLQHDVSLTPDELRFCCFNQGGRAQLQRGLGCSHACVGTGELQCVCKHIGLTSLALLIVLTECMFADHNHDGQLPTCVSRHTHAPPGAWKETQVM